MKISITKSDSKFDQYLRWLDDYKIDYEILDHESEEDDLSKFEKSSGLILTGGVDINPEIYCDIDSGDACGTYIPERDSFELKIIEKAIYRKMPILAICRGYQLMNVYFSGSLISDLKEIKNVDHERISETESRIHDVTIVKDTLLYDIMKTDSAEVNSSHHQAIDRIGEGLIVNAESHDGIVEGIEFAYKKDKPFFIGIQWHPERITDLNNPASSNIINYFINECKKFS